MQLTIKTVIEGHCRDNTDLHRRCLQFHCNAKNSLILLWIQMLI